MSEAGAIGGAGIEGARASLRALLDRYDHDNRVMVDQVYGQLSPTLDDFYDERLTIAFPRGRVASTDVVTPTISLVRVIPSGPTRRADNLGAPFPVFEASALVSLAAADPSAPEPVRNLASRLDHGAAWLAPRQVGRTQRVAVLVMPSGEDLASLLGLA